MPDSAAILSSNLTALRNVNPQAAELIAAANIPAGWEPVAGTDGTATFAQRVSDMHIEWLGRTSMPQASAEPLTANMTVGESNGLGTPIGTGYEWKHFAGRLPSRLMVYVFEPDPALARMALSVCDLSAHLANLKIVLLIGPDAAAQLVAILDAHIGLEPPAVIHPLASFPDQMRHALIAAGEQMVRGAINRRAEATQAAVEKLLHKSWTSQSVATPTETLGESAPALALLIRQDDTLPLTRRIRHFRIPTVELDQHRSASQLARLTALQQHDIACIESDLLRAQMDVPIPSAIPVRTWLPPLAAARYWEPGVLSPTGMESGDRVIAHSSAHADWLKAAGFSEQQISLVRLPFASPGAREKTADARRVAVIAELMPLDAESYGLTLPTHVAIWKTLRGMIENDPLGVHDGMSADLLRRAEQQTGVRLEDATLVQSLQRAIQHILLPSGTALGIARMLADAGIALDLIGGGWQQAGMRESEQVKMRPLADLTPEFWREDAIAVHAHPAGIVSPALLHALESGVTIIATPHPRDNQTLSLSAYLKDYPRVQKTQFVSTLRAMLQK